MSADDAVNDLLLLPQLHTFPVHQLLGCTQDGQGWDEERCQFAPYHTAGLGPKARPLSSGAGAAPFMGWPHL